MRIHDTGRGRRSSVLALAIVALLIHLAVPVLPIYGAGHLFYWSRFPIGGFASYLTQYFVASWIGAVALLVGIAMLRRERTGVAAGVFVAVAIVVLGTVANGVIPAPRAVLEDWRTTLIVGLETLEAAILLVAASIGMRR